MDRARLRFFLPRRLGYSPRIEVQDRRVTGAIQVSEERWGDAGHRSQYLVKRVGFHCSFDLSCDLVAMPAQGQQLLGQFRQHDPGRADAHDANRLLAQSGEHRFGEAVSGPRRMFLQSGFHLCAASDFQRSGSWIAGEEV